MGVHGSGIPLRYRGRHFIVTAAHVDDGDGRTAELLVGQSREPHALVMMPPDSVSTPMPPSNDRRHDDLDLAVIPISNLIAAGLEAIGATFIGFDGMALPESTPGAELLFTGYPDKMQFMYPLEDGRMQIEPQMSAIWLRQITAEGAATLGYPTNTHLVARFRHAANGPMALAEGRGVLTDVHGMSGGAAWLLLGDQMHFAGVVTKWHKDGNAGHLIATRTVFLPSMLDQAIETIPDHG